MFCAIAVMGRNSIVLVNNVMFLIFFLLFQFLKTQHVGAVIRAFQGASAAGVTFVPQSLAVGCRRIAIVGAIRRATGGIPKPGTLLILANRATRASRIFSQVWTSLAIVIHSRSSRQTALRSGFTAHRATVHISVTRIRFDFVLGLAIAIQTSFSVLNIALGNGSIVISGAAGRTFTGSIFSVTGFTNPVIWFLTGHII